MNTHGLQLENLFNSIAPEWTGFITSDLVNFITNHQAYENLSNEAKNLLLINSILFAVGDITSEVLPEVLQNDLGISTTEANMLAGEIIRYVASAYILLTESGVVIDNIKIEPVGEIPKPPKFVSPKALEASSRIEKIRPKPRKGNDDPYRESIN